MTVKPQTLSGTLSRILYQNANGWALIEVSPESSPPVTACGVMPRPVVGEHVVMEGYPADFPPPGRDFQFSSFTARAPTEEAAIVLYLADITRLPFESILPVVRRFQGETVNVLNNDPRRLAEVKTLDAEQRKALIDAWGAAKRTDQMMAELADLGVSQRHWDSVVQRVSKGTPVEEAIRLNPWLLYLHNEGLPFNRVKKVAQHLKVRMDSPEALRAAVLAVVRRATLLGNSFYNNAGLVGDVAPLIGRQPKPAEVHAAAQVLLEDKLLYARGTRLFVRSTYMAELNIPLGIGRLNHDSAVQTSGISDARLRQVLSKQLSPAQVELAATGLRPALSQGVTLVAARNGGDQLALVRAYRALLQALHLDFELAAAGLQFAVGSTRLTNSDHEVELIPDLLGIRNGQPPMFGQNNPLSQEAVVVFQAELLDVIAFDQILHGIRDDAALVLVGDPDSLPPVGPGAPFKHLWQREGLPRLDMRGFGSSDPSLRAAQQSFASGAPMPLTDEVSAAVSLQCIRAEELVDAVVMLGATTLPSALSLDPTTEVQVVLPSAQMRLEGQAPSNVLATMNAALRSAVLGNQAADPYAVGDKVVLMREHTSPNIPGGAVGRILSIHDSVAQVSFSGITASVRLDDDSLTHGWAHTAYRLHGASYPLVVLVVAPGQESFLSKELLYACACMATEKLVLVSQADFQQAALGTPHPLVASTLADRQPQEC